MDSRQSPSPANDLLPVAEAATAAKTERTEHEVALLALRGGAISLSPGAVETRGPTGATRSPGGASRDERQ